jgi:hypothetical protein
LNIFKKVSKESEVSEKRQPDLGKESRFSIDQSIDAVLFCKAHLLMSYLTL